MGASYISLLSELVAEYAEERVRQFPGKSFDLEEASRALAAMVAETGEKVTFSQADTGKITALLEGHPFLVRQPGARASWKPGLDRAQLKARA
ncbi:MAG: hypothetical protein JWL62_2911 [Hyphomicrobiales bacterium]|nr:hypothetical protein [Hyphomicrobiales bacterium]